MKKTLLLVFIHGFKGSDDTFGHFPKDLAALLSHALPKIDVLSIQYPRFETRGDLKDCVAKFKEWLQNKVIDLEVANGTPSPTVDPSVHVILAGHSMGGIVAAETLLSIARDEPVPPSDSNTTNSTTSTSRPQSPVHKGLGVPDPVERPSSAPPGGAATRLFFPRVQGVIAFDTPYLGISPGVLAHGAEEHINQASAAYKAFNGASQLFGFNNSRSPSPQPIANASSRGLPAPDGSGGWGKWGKLAMYGGAAAAVAGAAGAAYLNWNQINQGLVWASSHLEFVGCLARGAELQKRVESVVKLTETHDVGFANFYSALGEKVTKKTQYAGAMLGQDRTFCVIPKGAKEPDSPTGTKRNAPSTPNPLPKRQKTGNAELDAEMKEGEQVQEFAQDASKSKGKWVRCVNAIAADELRGHTSMFNPAKNPNYHAMLPASRTEVAKWVDRGWYESSAGEKDDEGAAAVDYMKDAEDAAEEGVDMDDDVDDAAAEVEAEMKDEQAVAGAEREAVAS